MSNFDEYLQNIHDINLSYLLLAQQLIRQDKFAAGCRLRVDDEVVIENLTKDSRIEALQQIHTGIILSTNLLNGLSEETAAAAEEA